MKPFFNEIQNFWAWIDTLGKNFGGAFRVYMGNLSAPIFGSVSPTCPGFPLINHYFYIMSLYPNPKYLFGIRI